MPKGFSLNPSVLDYREAKKVFRAELEKYLRNGLSLFGLQATLQGLGKDEADQVVKADLETAWKGQTTWILDFRLRLRSVERF